MAMILSTKKNRSNSTKIKGSKLQIWLFDFYTI